MSGPYYASVSKRRWNSACFDMDMVRKCDLKTYLSFVDISQCMFTEKRYRIITISHSLMQTANPSSNKSNLIVETDNAFANERNLKACLL